ncbi:hypothetical protein DA11_19085 [Aeromonas caviae]|nr:hypothetical protein DA11_19085 [Aeromonas caviae]
MAQPDDGSISIVVAIVAGLCSLLGAFIGAWVSRTSERIRWLRENQSEVFATFLEKLQKAGQSSFRIRLEHAEKGTDNSFDLIDAFADTKRYERIVRLYLRKSHRQEFSNLVDRYCKCCASGGKHEPDKPDAKSTLSGIQRIFEVELSG